MWQVAALVEHLLAGRPSQGIGQWYILLYHLFPSGFDRTSVFRSGPASEPRMHRFILQQNIGRFQALLEVENDQAVRRRIQEMLVSARRELALLEAARSGVQPAPRWPAAGRGDPNRSRSAAQPFRSQFERARSPYLLLDPGPGLHIVDINDAYASATMTNRVVIAGRPLFEVFPDNPDVPDADGVSNLHASLRAAAQTGRPHVMRVQRYDVRDRDGRFVERYWRPVNTPVLDDDGRLVYLLHHVEDVTSDVEAALLGPPTIAAE